MWHGERECAYMHNIRNDTIHKETNCGMDHTVSELHRIAFDQSESLGLVV